MGRTDSSVAGPRDVQLHGRRRLAPLLGAFDHIVPTSAADKSLGRLVAAAVPVGDTGGGLHSQAGPNHYVAVAPIRDHMSERGPASRPGADPRNGLVHRR